MKVWFRFSSFLGDLAFAISIINYYFMDNHVVSQHLVLTAIFLKVQAIAWFVVLRGRR